MTRCGHRNPLLTQGGHTARSAPTVLWLQHRWQVLTHYCMQALPKDLLTSRLISWRDLRKNHYLLCILLKLLCAEL